MNAKERDYLQLFQGATLLCILIFGVVLILKLSIGKISQAQSIQVIPPLYLTGNATGDRLTITLEAANVLFVRISRLDGIEWADSWTIHNGGLPVEEILLDVCGRYAYAATPGTEGIIGHTFRLPVWFPCEIDEQYKMRR